VTTSSPTNVPSQLLSRLKLCACKLLPLDVVMVIARTIVLVLMRALVNSDDRSSCAESVISDLGDEGLLQVDESEASIKSYCCHHC
jgi:hypothetical protein